MNYETALKLKEHEIKKKTILDGERKNSFVNPENKFADWEVNEEFIYVPLLEEIIAECGEEFAYLSKDYEHQWRARGILDDGLSMPVFYGPTPLIAVANLYCELNKK